MDEDAPFSYSFDTLDVCTKRKINLVNPIPASNNITTQLRYDLGGSCSRSADNLVMLKGFVADRFGARAELCNRKSQCPIVTLSPMPDINSTEWIHNVMSQWAKNEIATLQAVNDVTWAVQARHGQTKRIREGVDNADGNSIGKQLTRKQREQELATVLSVVTRAADEYLSADSADIPQKPRVQCS